MAEQIRMTTENDPRPKKDSLSEFGIQQNDKIALWRQSAASDFGSDDDGGIAAQLVRVCNETLSYISSQANTDSTSKRHARALRRHRVQLQLWADGHGVQDGHLDKILAGSKNLQHTILSVLNSLCKSLSEGLAKFTEAESDDVTLVFLRSNVARTLERTRWLVLRNEELASDSSSDSDSTGSEDETPHRRMVDFVEEIKTFLNCLFDLSTTIERPALDPRDEDEPSALDLGQRGAHDYHADLIKAKYPEAQLDLIECLGRISWNRYQRMQQERELNAEAAQLDSARAQNQSAVKSQAASSNFKDSGMGTSVPSTPSSRYAETVVSFMTGVSEGKRVSIPSLSVEAKKGEPFDCNACGRHISVMSNREWRQHLYLDLQPYTCFHVGCSFSTTPFASRQLWSQHLELDHAYGPQWNRVTCPLCREATTQGKSAILVHFARHMEDIALAAIPRDVESDEESIEGSDEDHSVQSKISEVLAADTSNHPPLSPIPSIAMSSVPDEDDSRGRSPHRWWESDESDEGMVLDPGHQASAEQPTSGSLSIALEARSQRQFRERAQLLQAEDLLRTSPDVITEMDPKPIHPQVLNESVGNSFPPEVRTWAQLKQLAIRDPTLLPGLNNNTIELLQALQFLESVSGHLGAGTPTIVKDQYRRLVANTKADIQQAANEVDSRDERGAHPKLPIARTAVPSESPTTDFEWQKILPNTDQSELVNKLIVQLEHYFSTENVRDDMYLRQLMDSQGSVPVEAVATFNRIKNVSNEISLIRYACRHSHVLELLDGQEGQQRVRRRDHGQPMRPGEPGNRVAGTVKEAANRKLSENSSIDADSGSVHGSSINMKPTPRKGHTKSRRGCFDCKRRRIKCNEIRPDCSHCVKAGLTCQYPPTSYLANIVDNSHVVSSKDGTWSNPQQSAQPMKPSVDLVNQYPPCNTLHLDNLPTDASEEELKAVFSTQVGYKRLCFRTKQNETICFVEFEDTSFATNAMQELNGYMLHNCVRGGIRLSFSKNPLGVRSVPASQIRPTQGDWLNIREMDPNWPDIARQVEQHGLNSDSDSDSDSLPESGEKMDNQAPTSAGDNTVHDVVQRGCFTCRLRKGDCDGGKPSCNACNSLELACEYSKPAWWDINEEKQRAEETIQDIVKHRRLTYEKRQGSIGQMTQQAAMREATVEEEEPSTIKCICGFSDDDGNTVLCEKCDTWQHIICFYNSFQDVPDVHECIDCAPRFVDANGARHKQRQRRKTQSIRTQVKSKSGSQKDSTISATSAGPSKMSLLGPPLQFNSPHSAGPSPTSSLRQSPISGGDAIPRMPPSQGPLPSVPSYNPAQSPYPYQGPTSSAYQPGPAPVFSNVQNPKNPLALVGVHPGMMPGFNSGHAAAMPHYLGHPPHQQPTANDRPFKCDQCPQSFNRNHDLKRHKRIHLAVKPWPCSYCDKSFSRHDALKRHILVKGHGKVSSGSREPSSDSEYKDQKEGR